MDIKSPSKNRQFQEITSKDEKGHYYFEGESELPKIKKLQSEIVKNIFIPSNATPSFFGLIPSHDK